MDVAVPPAELSGFAPAFAGLDVRMWQSARLVAAPLSLWTPTNSTQDGERTCADRRCPARGKIQAFYARWVEHETYSVNRSV